MVMMVDTKALIADRDVDASAEKERQKKQALSTINLAVKDCAVPYILDIADNSVLQKV